MSAPKVRKPADVPELRLWLIEQWQPGRPFQLAAEVANANMPFHSAYGQFSATEPRWDLQVLHEATLWYVTREMCDLVIAAAAQLPGDLELTHDMPPDPYGFVVFERPLVGKDAVTDGVVLVDALAWGPGMVLPRGLEGMGIQTYRQLPLHLGLSAEEMEQGYRSGALLSVFEMMRTGQTTEIVFAEGADEAEVWSWLGRSDWLYAHTIDSKIVPDIPDSRAESMAEDRRWLAALWFLSQQPNLSGIVEADIPRPTRRRSDRANVESKVRIVNLRKPKIDKDSDAPAGFNKVEWSKRWLVGGHWRFQPFGPERKLRKWVWIAPYVKGPEDKPLVVKETVKVIK